VASEVSCEPKSCIFCDLWILTDAYVCDRMAGNTFRPALGTLDAATLDSETNVEEVLAQPPTKKTEGVMEPLLPRTTTTGADLHETLQRNKNHIDVADVDSSLSEYSITIEQPSGERQPLLTVCCLTFFYNLYIIFLQSDHTRHQVKQVCSRSYGTVFLKHACYLWEQLTPVSHLQRLMQHRYGRVHSTPCSLSSNRSTATTKPVIPSLNLTTEAGALEATVQTLQKQRPSFNSNSSDCKQPTPSAQPHIMGGQ
jgi:hypothetical protein